MNSSSPNPSQGAAEHFDSDLGHQQPSANAARHLGQWVAWHLSGPGKRVFPIEPVYEPDLLGDATSRIDSRLYELFGHDLPWDRYVEISLEAMIPLLEDIPIREEDPSSWNTSAISQILRALSSRNGDRGMLYMRENGAKQ